MDKDKANKQFSDIFGKLVSAREKTEAVIKGTMWQNSAHIDIFTGHRPTLSHLDFVEILLTERQQDPENSLLSKIFPEIGKEDRESLVLLIQMWMLLTVRIDSCERILNIIQQSDKTIDKVALLRECESPRNIIEKKIFWVCFEAEMKLQIWASQYQTYHTLMRGGETGIASQLNMGEGKTQIIIPMITLELLFGDAKKARIPRVNLLNSLFSESKFNYFRFLSATAFNVAIVELPFDRSVDLEDPFVNQKISLSLNHFKDRMMLLLDQSSTHSMILKLRECAIKAIEE